MKHIFLITTLVFLIMVMKILYAHQPVMDMTPRWQGGYGFQIRNEWRSSDKLLDGDSEISNPNNRKTRVNQTWLEGVYTFRRELRFTFKLPWIDQSRINSSGVYQKERALGDLILGIPLKKYWNWENSTGNISLTPSLRLPTGKTGGPFPTGDGSTDIGLSFSFSLEKAHLYQFYDLFYWFNNKGDRVIHEGDELGFDGNIGIHPYHNNLTNTGIFLMIDVTARYQQKGENSGATTGGTRLMSGPIFVFYHEGMMARAELKLPVYENVEGTQVSFGSQLNIGVGFVFLNFI